MPSVILALAAGASLIGEVPEKPFEIARDENVHGRTECFFYPTNRNFLLIISDCLTLSPLVPTHTWSIHGIELFIFPCFPEPGQDIVRIGGYHQFSHR